MRPIIVGTDFSQGSLVALEVAVDIANKMATDIRLIWVNKDKKAASGEYTDDITRLAQDKLQALCNQYNATMTQGRIEWLILQGKVPAAIADAERQFDACMVCIGTNGASGYEKYLMGSTAVRIVQEVSCPVLSIREGFNFHKSLERIVVPIRMNANSRQKVPAAVRMARIFGSHVYILGLTESAEMAYELRTYLKQVEHAMAAEGISYTTVGRRYENYADTVLHYCDDIHADLVVINTEQDRLLARLFLGTNAQQIVHRAQIPVLSIHPVDIGSVAR